MANEIEFPDCIFDVLRAELARIPGVSLVVERPLASTDPNGALGINYEEWNPVEYEIGGGRFDPTLSDYVVHIEHMVKSTSREDGLKTHRSVARSIRSMLYRDPAVQVALRQLVHVNTSPEFIERLKKWTIQQRFVSNQIERSFYFVSGTTVTFQTETV